MAEFSKQLERLEAIVRQLESEDLDLDEALKLFEEGIERLRVAREQLQHAELKVKKVLEAERPPRPPGSLCSPVAPARGAKVGRVRQRDTTGSPRLCLGRDEVRGAGGVRGLM